MMSAMDDAYRPGVCNIGPVEIEHRRRSAIAATIALVLVSGLLLAIHLPAILRLGIWPVAAAAGVTWLQVVRRFCVGFAALGFRNFGARGDASRVGDDAALRADRRTATRMVLEGSLYGALYAVALALLPI